MPQEHYVLRCFSCETFQVHIVKKAKKWECKMCGAKQSLKRNYGKGSGKDCRAQVMKLNELRILKGNNVGQVEDDSLDKTLTDELNVQELKEKKTSTSKWLQYLDESEPDANDYEDVETNYSNNANSKKRKRASEKTFDENTKYDSKRMCNTKFMRDIPLEVRNECGHSSSVVSHPKHPNFDKQKPKMNDKALVIHSNSFCKLKQSKYCQYLDEDESESNSDLLGSVNKSSNVFDSDLTDLDDILNF